MNLAQARMPLLGLLAQEKWFTRMGEPALTRVAAALLGEPDLAQPIIDWLEMTMQVDLPEIVMFVPEMTGEDGKRPDIVGLDAERQPRLIIECKVDAPVDIAQIAAYRREQARLLGPARDGAVTVLIVPERRLSKAWDEFDRIPELLPDLVRADDRLARTGVAPWEEWLSVWDKALTELPQGPDTVASDVVQFRALCRTLLKSVIDPLGASAAGAAWRDREADVLRLPDLVASRLNYHLWHEGFDRHTGQERRFPFRRRRSITVSWAWPLTEADIGIRPDRADSGDSPLWLRFRADRSADFQGVQSRIQASSFADRVRVDGGHLWLPLELAQNLGNDDLIDSIVTELQAIIRLVAEDGADRV